MGLESGVELIHFGAKVGPVIQHDYSKHTSARLHGRVGLANKFPAPCCVKGLGFYSPQTGIGPHLLFTY
jgi:hypothetical protein